MEFFWGGTQYVILAKFYIVGAVIKKGAENKNRQRKNVNVLIRYNYVEVLKLSWHVS